MLAIGVEPPAGRDPTPRYHGDVFRNPAMPMSLAADAAHSSSDTPMIRRRDAVVPGSWPEGTLPLLARLYASRGAGTPELALPKLGSLHAPELLTGIDDAVGLLIEAIANDRRILVVGDFDCDGATACAVGVRGLRMLGAQHVFHAVPNRMVHGYGLSPSLVEELAALQPDLLVTVDHGIACHAGVNAAKARGWQVLVTDHHLPGRSCRRPMSSSIPISTVMPSQQVTGRRRRDLLRADGAAPAHARGGRLRRWQGPDLTMLLDLVAVGTVADLVALDPNNRALVSAGLRRLRAGQGCVGLRALIEASGRDAARLTATDIGFALGRA